MKKKVKIKKRNYKVIMTILLLIAVGIWFFFLRGNKGPDCNKWLYLKSLDKKINSVPEAIASVRSALPDEKRFKNYPVPETEADFKKIYNLAPFAVNKEVKEKSGTYVTKEVYDLLLGLYIDHEGNVYKYNDCSRLI